jgi:transcriptional regulator with XRE-family HTH domain
MWECGFSHPRAELLPKIAMLYKCSIDDLIKSNPTNNAPAPNPPPIDSPQL